MPRISYEIEVPEGPFCQNYEEAKVLPPPSCPSLVVERQPVSWKDGLGSPGTITHRRCGFFNIRLHSSTPPVKVSKCDQCLEACNAA